MLVAVPRERHAPSYPVRVLPQHPVQIGAPPEGFIGKLCPSGLDHKGEVRARHPPGLLVLLYPCPCDEDRFHFRPFFMIMSLNPPAASPARMPVPDGISGPPSIGARISETPPIPALNRGIVFGGSLPTMAGMASLTL